MLLIEWDRPRKSLPDLGKQVQTFGNDCFVELSPPVIITIAVLRLRNLVRLRFNARSFFRALLKPKHLGHRSFDLLHILLAALIGWPRDFIIEKLNSQAEKVQKEGGIHQ